MGDFNFDGADDFAAILVRAATDEDLRDLQERHRHLYDTVSMVVVCNGTAKADESSRYECWTVTGPTPGGIYGELDIVDWSGSIDELSGKRDSNGNPECGTRIEAADRGKLLSLIEPIGHCDTFYFPGSDAGYGSCTYCAD